jgi:thiol-disulfide isomerase/thioredoxin
VSSSLIGKPAPAFVLPVLSKSNTIVHLADFKGKVVVLNFWQSSCDPCGAEAPFMQKTWTQLQSKGIVFIGVDMLDTSNGAYIWLSISFYTVYMVCSSYLLRNIQGGSISGFSCYRSIEDFRKCL